MKCKAELERVPVRVKYRDWKPNGTRRPNYKTRYWEGVAEIKGDWIYFDGKKKQRFATHIHINYFPEFMKVVEVELEKLMPRFEKAVFNMVRGKNHLSFSKARRRYIEAPLEEFLLAEIGENEYARTELRRLIFRRAQRRFYERTNVSWTVWKPAVERVFHDHASAGATEEECFLACRRKYMRVTKAVCSSDFFGYYHQMKSGWLPLANSSLPVA
ncbi:MAG: hypothetical protein R3C18_21235 [Planctomycetaceae bacterium]